MKNSSAEEYVMQRFSFVVLPTLLLLVMILVGCQSDHEKRIGALEDDHEDRIAVLENEHSEKIANLEQEILYLKSMQSEIGEIQDVLVKEIACDPGTGEQPPNPPLNASLVYSDSETGVVYDLQPPSITHPYRFFLRHVVCDGVGGGLKAAWIADEEFDSDKHPLNHITFGNAILVDKLCFESLGHPAVGVYTKSLDGLPEGYADRLSEMCKTYKGWVSDYRANASIATPAWRHAFYNLVEERLRPPEEAAQE